MALIDTEKRDLPKELDEVVISMADSNSKWRRFKVGCKVDECLFNEVLSIKDILCRQPCYLDEDDFKKLKQKLIKISNGRRILW